MILRCFIYYCGKFQTDTINQTVFGKRICKTSLGKMKTISSHLKQKARHSAGKESIRLIKKKFCSQDNNEVLYTLKREELFARTHSRVLRNSYLIILISIYGHFFQCKETFCSR